MSERATKAPVPSERLPRKVPDHLLREIAGESILVPVRGNLADLRQIVALSPVGRHIWIELDRQVTVAGLRRSIVERFDVDESQAEADLLEFLVELRKSGLVTE